MVTISNLPAKTESEIKTLLDSGDYETATDIVVHAITDLSNRRAQTERLRAQIQEGENDFATGAFCQLTPELLDERWESALARFNTDDSGTLK